MLIATWNVNSLRVRLAQVLDWIGQHQPDILCLQETKLEDKDFPHEVFSQVGYAVSYSGQKTYNGVATLSRTPAADIIMALSDTHDEQKRLLAATIADTRVINVYVPNGSEVGSEKYAYKLVWLKQLKQFLQNELKSHDKLVVLGDYNIAPADADVHDPELWHGSVLVSDKERAALKQLIDLGLSDVFRRFEQPEKSFSWWDYRAAAFRRNRGLRIDLILASTSLAKRCHASYIDKEPRKLERPSDHAPVIAEFS